MFSNTINTALKPAVSSTSTTGCEERGWLAAGDTRRAAVMQECLLRVRSAVRPGSTCAYSFGNSPSFQPCGCGPRDIAGTRLPPGVGARSPRRHRLQARQARAGCSHSAAGIRAGASDPSRPPPQPAARPPPRRPASPRRQPRTEVPAPGPAQPALRGAANGARGRGGAEPIAPAASALRGETRRERRGELDGARTAPQRSAAPAGRTERGRG